MRRVFFLPGVFAGISACAAVLGIDDVGYGGAEGDAGPGADGDHEAGNTDAAAADGSPDGGADSSTTDANADAPVGLYVFVTSSTYTGGLPGTGDGGATRGDAICNLLAGDAGLSGVYVAWLSDSSQRAAIDLLPPGGGPWHLTGLSNAVVFSSPNDIAAGTAPAHPIQYTERGVPLDVAASYAWTGTTPTGLANTSSPKCLDWMSDSGIVAGSKGNTNATSTNWTEDGPLNCGASAHLYCFQVQ